jgi:hypothetical protein
MMDTDDVDHLADAIMQAGNVIAEKLDPMGAAAPMSHEAEGLFRISEALDRVADGIFRLASAVEDRD